jgi:hypothetical protein
MTVSEYDANVCENDGPRTLSAVVFGAIFAGSSNSA